jgi:hypothetical protein
MRRPTVAAAAHLPDLRACGDELANADRNAAFAQVPVLVTLFLKVWHYCLLRAVVLGQSDDYFVEIGFLSENYAQEFASLNKVQLSES